MCQDSRGICEIISKGILINYHFIKLLQKCLYSLISLFELTMCSCSVFVVDLRKKMQEKVLTYTKLREVSRKHVCGIPARDTYASEHLVRSIVRLVYALLEDATLSKKKTVILNIHQLFVAILSETVWKFH